MSGQTLGCASAYTLVFHWRGGRTVYAVPAAETTTRVRWGRTLNGVSEAEVTIAKVGNTPDCCRLLGSIHPWVHEVSVYRDTELVWQGPVIDITFTRTEVKVIAWDVTAWLDRLVNRFRLDFGNNVRAGKCAKDMITANLFDTDIVPTTYVDWPGIACHMIATDTPKVRIQAGAWFEYAGVIVREWTKFGMDYTTVGRAIWFRPQVQQVKGKRIVARATLTDEAFAGELEVRLSGREAATLGVAVTNRIKDAPAGFGYHTPNVAGNAYGRLDRLERLGLESGDVHGGDPAPVPKWMPTLMTAARQLVAGRYPCPTTVSVPEGSRLTPSAPVAMSELVCGEPFSIVTSSTCASVQAMFRLADVAVEWESPASEAVAVNMIPIPPLVEDVKPTTPPPLAGAGAEGAV